MAGPSAADVRSVFSLPPSTPGPSQAKQAAERAKKPEGMSRELYSLIGQSAPMLVAQLAKPRLKQKPNLGGGGRVKWEWRSFANPARTDGLKLSHWVKASTPADAEYSFAKYNVHNPVLTYTQDEYNRYLSDESWTKEETDYLFELVREFDQRFYVIADRYDFPGGTPRSIDDIKDRYCRVCRELITYRPWPGDEAGKTQALANFSFDKNREVNRKEYLASLENRTAEEIAEEEALFTELKRLEQNERRFKREREELLRTILGIEAGLPDIHVDEDTLSAAPVLHVDTSTKKNKRKASEMETPVSAVVSPSVNATIALGPPVVKKQSAKSAAYDAQHCIHRNEVPQTTTTSTKAAHHPVFLRSYKLPAPKSAIAPKIAQVLGELSISHTRLVMPTKDNCTRLEQLIEAATALVETKKQVDRIDHEIKVAQERLAATEEADGEDDGDGDGEGDGDGDGDEMDIDDVAVNMTTRAERGTSVGSTRSNRSRKKSGRRSMSMSMPLS